MKDKLTVILPVYNVENYILDCLNSIKEQEYEPIEVILVDDGSPDGSAELCEEIALADDRFCVIHKKNGGLSDARNTGILISNSEMITFVDSDDALIGQPYSYLMDVAKKQNADVVAMSAYVSRDAVHSVDNAGDSVILKELDSAGLYKELCLQTVSESAWNKIYKSEIFKGLLFDVGVQNEDFLFLIKLAASRDIRLVQTDYLGYYYYLHQGSITGSGFKRNMIDALRNAHFALENAPNDECKYAAEYYMLHRALMFLINMPKSYISDKNEDYLFAKRCIYELRNKINASACPTKNKILLLIFLKMPIVAKKIADIYMKKLYKG